MSTGPASRVHKRTRNGCFTCRARHVKCDEQKPICLRCRRIARPCSYPLSVSLVETSRQNGRASSSSSNNAPEEENGHGAERNLTVFGSPTQQDWASHESVAETHGPENQPFQTLRPTSDPQVFQLLKYYVERVAVWLDLSDGDRHFTRVVPREMLRFPILFHAVCAFSATQISRHEQEYTMLAEMHHARCIKAMIPVMESEDLAADGRILAATVILRMYEMQNSSPDHDPQRHLTGAWSLTQIPRSGEFDSLRAAAFWIFLRQDVQMAERHRRQTIIDLDQCQFQSRYDTTRADDTVWANRMVWIYAHVVNYCFGLESDRTQIKWAFLMEQLDKWKKHLPDSFTPLYHKPFPRFSSHEEPEFPTDWFLCDWHIYAAQTYHMAKLLLNLFNSYQNPTGLHGLREIRSRDAILKYHARAICGISMSNSCEAARIHACEHLRICREILVLPKERQMITELIQQVQKNTGWKIFPDGEESNMGVSVETIASPE